MATLTKEDVGIHLAAECETALADHRRVATLTFASLADSQALLAQELERLHTALGTLTALPEPIAPASMSTATVSRVRKKIEDLSRRLEALEKRIERVKRGAGWNAEDSSNGGLAALALPTRAPAPTTSPAPAFAPTQMPLRSPACILQHLWRLGWQPQSEQACGAPPGIQCGHPEPPSTRRGSPRGFPCSHAVRYMAAPAACDMTRTARHAATPAVRIPGLHRDGQPHLWLLPLPPVPASRPAKLVGPARRIRVAQQPRRQRSTKLCFTCELHP